MTSSERGALGLALALVFVSSAVNAQPAPSPSPAPSAQAANAADLETARNLYREGKALRAQGDLVGALAKLKAAHALGRTPITGLELARTYEMLHLIVEARTTCLDVADIPIASDETERSVTARSEAATFAEQLRRREATLVVHLEGVAPGAVVSLVIDGARIPPAAMRELHNANPGTHEVSARVEGGVAVTTTFEVKEGETREVTLTLPPPPVVHVEMPKDFETHTAPKPSRNGVATAAFALGGVGIVVGTLTGLLAMSKKSDLDSACGAQKQCGPGSADDLDAAKSWATFSTVAFVAGGVGAAVGIVAILAGRPGDSPHEGASLYIGPGSVGLHGAF